MGTNEIQCSLEVPRDGNIGNSTSKKIRLGVTLGEFYDTPARIRDD